MSAKELVDAYIDRMKMLGDDFALLPKRTWRAFIAETGIQPEPFGNDFLITYRGMEFRQSAAR